MHITIFLHILGLRHMAGHAKCSFLSQAFIFIACFTGMIPVESGRPGFSYYKTSPHSPPHAQPQDFPNEELYRAYIVIQRFKNTITCDPRNITSTWSGHDICGERSYVGFHCAKLGGSGNNLAVTSAIFNGFGLCAPKLQGFVDQLPHLVLFQATSNNFGGNLPSQQLVDLIKTYNHDVLDGRPAELSESKGSRLGGPRVSAVSVDGYGVKAKSQGDLIYTFTHPTTVSIMPLLPKNNPLTPSTKKLGSPKMSYIALANNKLTGPIPPSIKEAKDTLIEVLLLNNQLSGCLPHELGMLHKAAMIDAGMNQLTGPIPSSFSCLSSVEQLNLAGNRLYGQVPDALCKLAGPAGRLANLTLSGNYFTSVGPACTALIKDGVLEVKNNCIPGLPNQRRPAECAAFQSLPKTTCPAASTQVTCPAVAAENAAAPAERKVRDYSSYVTYATLHD